MATANQFTLLSADKPQDDPKRDRFGYAKIAKHLAEALCKMPMSEGFVIAVHGDWGSGKSTLLNYIKAFLKEECKKSEQPIIVPFNPWWFSGKENLARHLFDEIEKNLPTGENFKDLRKRIADLADIVDKASDIPVIPPQLALPAKTLSKVAKSIRPTQHAIVELKQKVTSILHKQKRKILILVDDIDRLTSEEIRQLFGVIKTVADLPNTIYILAFDRAIVGKALDEEQNLPGEAYLEKIIQLPIELPVPEPEALHMVLIENLSAIYKDSPDPIFPKEAETPFPFHSQKWHNHIMFFISTPRHVVRLINALSITYFAVQNEVNPVDFTIIETLRVFCPLAYDILRKNKEAFVGYPSSVIGIVGDDLRHERAFHNAWIALIDEPVRDAVKGLLTHCFPVLNAIFNNQFASRTDYSIFRRHKRICDPDMFDRYFRLALNEWQITNAEMSGLLALVSDSNAFADKLLDFAKQRLPDGTPRVNLILLRLLDYVDSDIPDTAIPTVVQALFRIGDVLLADADNRPRKFWGILGGEELTEVIWRLLERLKEPSRFQRLQDAFNNSEAITTVVGKVIQIGQQFGKYGSTITLAEDQALVTRAHLAELESLALKKVQEAAAADILPRSPNISVVLYWWGQMSPEEAKDWFESQIAADAGLVAMLKKFTVRIADGAGQEEISPYLDRIKSLCDYAKLAFRIGTLLERANLDSYERIVLERFKAGLEIYPLEDG